MQVPSEIVMDNNKATRGLFYTPKLEEALPFLDTAFDEVDALQNYDRRDYLEGLSASVFTFKHRLGKVTCAAFWNNTGYNATEALVTWPPFSDCAPHSSADKIADYSFKQSANLLDVVRAKPNSWRQVIKAATSNELEHALGSGKIVLSFFSIMPKTVFSFEQRRAIMNGDFAPSGEIMEHGLSIVQDMLHGPKSETQISELHIAGASQGAHQAIGSASYLASKQEKYAIKSVTTQELILGAHNLRTLQKGLGGQVGEKGTAPDFGTFIPELGLLHDIDAHGNEPAMFWRVVQAAVLKAGNMRGITKSGETLHHIDNLAAYGVPQTALLAENSLITHQTEAYLYPYRRDVEIIKIKATEGQYADHLADENANVVATGIALGTRRA